MSMLSRAQIVGVFTDEGYRCVDASLRTYAETWRQASTGEILNLKRNDAFPVVIHPNHEARISELLSIPGVLRGRRAWAHDSNFRGFPSRLNGGERPIAYGLDFGFESVSALSSFLAALSRAHTPEEDIAAAIDLPGDASERDAVIAARRGQGIFRRRLDDAWGRCAVTGCVHRALLRASHIKPWRIASNAERLSADNGLLLAAHVDAAFDAGLVSFADDGRILISARLTPTDATASGIHAGMRLREVKGGNLHYLVQHREMHGFNATA